MSAAGGAGSRKRALTREEEEVWSLITRTLTPLKKRKPATIGRSHEAEAGKAAPAHAAAKMSARPHSPPAQAQAPAARLQPLEPLLRRKLARGRLRPDMKIDLHGMRQGEAHTALLAFLRRARERDARLVIVVTGKGQGSASREQEPWDYSRHPGGVLQRMTRHWLGAPELRDIVIGFEEADGAHGGSGALYVRLRRNRNAGGDEA